MIATKRGSQNQSTHEKNSKWQKQQAIFYTPHACAGTQSTCDWCVSVCMSNSDCKVQDHNSGKPKERIGERASVRTPERDRQHTHTVCVVPLLSVLLLCVLLLVALVVSMLILMCCCCCCVCFFRLLCEHCFDLYSTLMKFVFLQHTSTNKMFHSIVRSLVRSIAHFSPDYVYCV